MPSEIDSSIIDVGNSGKKSRIKDKSSAGSKHNRKRKRRHFNAIREQMEFYFGDANLSKDRYLKQLIDKDPFVPLDIFLTFNKLKALTTSVADIAKSLSNSQLLELDESLQKVRRKTELPAERNVDDKTLYVESLPPNADHDWVKQIFVRFGNVTYVSLPKYAKSRKIKEFGFIEFEKQESIAKAVKAFQDFNGVLSMQQTEPAELKSVQAFIKEQNNVEESATNELNKKAGQKRTNADNTSEQPAAKKIKTTDDDDVDDESSNSNSQAGAITATETDTDVDPAEPTQKKRRRKKNKSKKLDKQKRNVEQNNDATFYDLKILPKRDWKRLRNKYLNLQREKVAELKRKAWREAQKPQIRENLTDGIENNPTGQQTPSKKYKPSERKLHKMNMNFYGAGDSEITDTGVKVGFTDKNLKNNPALERAPLFSYEPGLIVEVGFQEPCVSIKEFKADMRQYECVKYVDVKEGGIQAHLRLESADAVEDFVRKVNCAEYKCKVIAGDAEKDYWQKIEQDREMKLNKKVKVPQKRGREKMKQILKKHIRFGDDGPADVPAAGDDKKITIN